MAFYIYIESSQQKSILGHLTASVVMMLAVLVSLYLSHGDIQFYAFVTVFIPW